MELSQLWEGKTFLPENMCIKPDRQWRNSSFQESKKVRVSRDLWPWPWPWPWTHPECMLTWSSSCESLVAIRLFDCEKKRFAQKFTDRQTDGQTDRRRTPRHCISSFLEWAKNNKMPEFYMIIAQKIFPQILAVNFPLHSPSPTPYVYTWLAKVKYGLRTKIT